MKTDSIYTLADRVPRVKKLQGGIELLVLAGM